jgi:hypothetical protein
MSSPPNGKPADDAIGGLFPENPCSPPLAGEPLTVEIDDEIPF